MYVTRNEQSKKGWRRRQTKHHLTTPLDLWLQTNLKWDKRNTCLIYHTQEYSLGFIKPSWVLGFGFCVFHCHFLKKKLYYMEDSARWCSRLRRIILAKILASRGMFAAAAAERSTRASPPFCMRLAWCIAWRPPDNVNWIREQNTKCVSYVSQLVLAFHHILHNWRSAKAAHDLSTEEGLRNIVKKIYQS